jgi:hypothetical protein
MGSSCLVRLAIKSSQSSILSGLLLNSARRVSTSFFANPVYPIVAFQLVCSILLLVRTRQWDCLNCRIYTVVQYSYL